MVTDRHVSPDQLAAAVDAATTPVTTSLTATETTADGIARTILAGFDDYRRQFNQITAGARQRFEQADWLMMQKATMERVDLYDLSVSQTTSQLRALATERGCNASIEDEQLWKDTKRCYSRRNVKRSDGELTETYFNSIYCRTFRHHAINDDKIFVRSRLPAGWEPPQTEICHYYALDGSLTRLIGQILADYSFSIPYENRRRDVRNMVQHIKCHPMEGILMNQGARLKIARSVFYRNKAAYIIGQAVSGDGAITAPFVIAILNNEQAGVYVDTLILDPDDVSVLFSFTRSYFMVHATIPLEYVRFICDLLPGKRVFEIYNSLGFFKHGKTMFYRDYLDHMASSDDEFVVAAGIKGMVMTVFTLPSLDVVFKIIKDRFTPPKEMTRELVKQKYRLVKRHDKAGRMADTQEFSNFSFDRGRFSDELVEELLAVAPSTVEVTGDRVIIKHLWIERRMIPLNIYIDHCTEQELVDAIDEYGNALRQLSAANIFPGDMLFKNFGVTRHGRVVFYDYDEICYLTECNFRKVPPPRYPEDELAAEPWYSIGPDDVFPEEFRAYLTARQDVRKVFNQFHSEIFDAEYWRGLQQAINAGEVVDVFPYRRKKRFSRQFSLQNRSE